MNYIALINSFWDLAMMNPMATGQVSLYFALLHICNRSNWPEWFQAPNQVLSVLTGMSRSGILKARNELKQKGLIDFRERGTKTTVYSITISNSTQDSVQIGVQDSNQDGVQDSVQIGVQGNTILLNNINNIKTKTETKTKKKGTNVPQEKLDCFFDELWKLYPVKRGKGSVSRTQKTRLYAIGEDHLKRALDRYLADLKKDTWRKPQNGSTFFNSGYKDYLDENYAPEGGQDDEGGGSTEDFYRKYLDGCDD